MWFHHFLSLFSRSVSFERLYPRQLLFVLEIKKLLQFPPCEVRTQKTGTNEDLFPSK